MEGAGAAVSDSDTSEIPTPTQQLVPDKQQGLHKTDNIKEETTPVSIDNCGNTAETKMEKLPSDTNDNLQSETKHLESDTNQNVKDSSLPNDEEKKGNEDNNNMDAQRRESDHKEDEVNANKTNEQKEEESNNPGHNQACALNSENNENTEKNVGGDTACKSSETTELQINAAECTPEGAAASTDTGENTSKQVEDENGNLESVNEYSDTTSQGNGPVTEQSKESAGNTKESSEEWDTAAVNAMEACEKVIESDDNGNVGAEVNQPASDDVLTTELPVEHDDTAVNDTAAQSVNDDNNLEKSIECNSNVQGTTDENMSSVNDDTTDVINIDQSDILKDVKNDQSNKNDVGNIEDVKDVQDDNDVTNSGTQTSANVSDDKDSSNDTTPQECLDIVDNKYCGDIDVQSDHVKETANEKPHYDQVANIDCDSEQESQQGCIDKAQSNGTVNAHAESQTTKLVDTETDNDIQTKTEHNGSLSVDNINADNKATERCHVSVAETSTEESTSEKMDTGKNDAKSEDVKVTFEIDSQDANVEDKEPVSSESGTQTEVNVTSDNVESVVTPVFVDPAKASGKADDSDSDELHDPFSDNDDFTYNDSDIENELQIVMSPKRRNSKTAELTEILQTLEGASQGCKHLQPMQTIPQVASSDSLIDAYVEEKAGEMEAETSKVEIAQTNDNENVDSDKKSSSAEVAQVPAALEDVYSSNAEEMLEIEAAKTNYFNETLRKKDTRSGTKQKPVKTPATETLIAAKETPITETPMVTEASITEPPTDTETPTTEAPAVIEVPITETPAATETPVTEPPIATETSITETPVATATPISIDASATLESEEAPKPEAASAEGSTTLAATTETSQNETPETEAVMPKSDTQVDDAVKSAEVVTAEETAQTELKPADASESAVQAMAVIPTETTVSAKSQDSAVVPCDQKSISDKVKPETVIEHNACDEVKPEVPVIVVEQESKLDESKVEDSNVQEAKEEHLKLEESKVSSAKMEESKDVQESVEESKIEESKVEESQVAESKDAVITKTEAMQAKLEPLQEEVKTGITKVQPKESDSDMKSLQARKDMPPPKTPPMKRFSNFTDKATAKIERYYSKRSQKAAENARRDQKSLTPPRDEKISAPLRETRSCTPPPVPEISVSVDTSQDEQVTLPPRSKDDTDTSLLSGVVLRRKPQQARQEQLEKRSDQYLQQKIDHEIRMRDGTAKLLAASKHPQQMLEAAKNLLTSNSRMIAYMSELQRRKTHEAAKRNRAADGNQIPCKGKVAVSELRIPLMWKDSDHFKNKGDHRRYAVFCLWKIGTEIYDTAILKDVDRSMTDLSFDDIIVFNDIKPDFECRLEVYCHKLCEDLTMASTHRRIKKKFNEISTSVGRSVGKRLSGVKDETDFMANMLVGPKFEMIACANLKLADITNSTATYDLISEPVTVTTGTHEGAAADLPLFGHFCCRLVAQPHCMVKETCSGFLQVKDSGSWKQYWCQLRGLALNCHDSPAGSDSKKKPCLKVKILKNTQVFRGSPSSGSGQSHCFQLSSSSKFSKTHVFSAESEAELEKWWQALQQNLLDLALWQHACEEDLDIPELPSHRQSSYISRQTVTRSLYDEVSWKDNAADSPMTRILARLNVDDEEDVDLESDNTSRKSDKVETDV